MEPWIAIVVALISATGGIITERLITGWREAHRGRKNEAQRIAEDRDKVRYQRDEERRSKLEWMDATYAARAAYREGDPLPPLPPLPD